MALVTVKNPSRPPKDWFDECVKSVKRRKSSTDPERLCGWVWHHQMGPKAKAVALRTERRGRGIRNPKRESGITNPFGYSPGDRVKTEMGVRQSGTVIKRFPWRESTDGTYKAPGKGYVPVKWDDGTKGYHYGLHLLRILKLKRNPKRKRSQKYAIYLGYRNGKYEIFHSVNEPTPSSHGRRYSHCMGPFSTLGGARFMRDFGRGNPHVQSVADAERLARFYARGA